MKMNRIVSLLFIVIVSCVLLTGCEIIGLHNHVFDEKWTFVKEGHYKKCQCHEDVIEIIPHEDVDKDGRCDECNYVIERVKTYEVLVKYNNKPLEGIDVKFSYLGTENVVSTGKTGLAKIELIYVEEVIASLVSLPEEYIMPEKIKLVANERYVINLAKEKTTYTINTQEVDGKALSNVVVSLMLDNKIVHKKTTDETGVVTFDVDANNYKLVIKHINTSFELTETEDIILTPEKTTYTATFTRNEGDVEYKFDFVNKEGAKIKDLIVYIFDEYGESKAAMSINSIGEAITYIPNGNYYISVFNKEKGNVIYYLSKDCSSYNKLVFDPQEKAGLSENSPILIYDLVDKPYNYDNFMLFNWDYQFTSNETIYVKVPNALGKEFSIDGNKFSVSYNNIVLEPNKEGKIITHFEAAQLGDDVIMKITAKEEGVEDIKFVDYSDPRNVLGLRIEVGKISTFALDFYYEGQTRKFYLPTNSEGTLTLTAENATLNIEKVEVVEGGEVYLTITALAAGEVKFVITYSPKE